jgi:hypothetical protein
MKLKLQSFCRARARSRNRNRCFLRSLLSEPITITRTATLSTARARKQNKFSHS